MSYYFFWNFLSVLAIINLANVIDIKIDDITTYISVFGISFCIFFLAQKIGLIQIATKAYGDNFITQFFGHSYLGNYLIFPIIITLSNLQHQKRKSYLLLTIFIVTLFLSNARSAFVGLFVGLIFLKFPHKKMIYAILGILILVIQFNSSLPNDQLKGKDGSRPEYFRQAISGIQQSPIIGNGPNTFDIINRQLKKPGSSSANTSHNSILDYMSNNGVIFTFLFFSIIVYGLTYQFKSHPLLFSLGIASFSSSLIDSFWSNYGLLAISLFCILYRLPVLSTTNPKFQKISNIYISILSILILTFFLSKTTSDLLFFNGNYQLSLIADPFNINSRLKLIDDPTQKALTLRLFKSEEIVYKSLISQSAKTSEKEQYLKQLIDLNPNSYPSYYYMLGKIYQDNQNFQSLSLLLNKFEQNNQKYIPLSESLPIAKLFYFLALNEWQNQQYPQAIGNMNKSITFSNGWSQFHIELANMYWHQNQPDLASFQLTSKCTDSKFSSKACLEYLSEGTFLLPGSPELIRSIEDINYQ